MENIRSQSLTCLLPAPPVPAEVAKTRSKSTLTAPRVLLVDDLTPTHWLVSTFLNRAYFDVVTLSDPDQAVSAVYELQPDAIVIDPASAGQAGWLALAELQSDPFAAQIPTVIYTDFEEAVIADHAAQCQYDDLRFVSKAEDLDLLLDRIAEAAGAASLAESWSA